ncbi:hypothetical protein ACLQ24_30255, partial [Micromonospora sp. DT4]|uniref:hypothetical protein n=1 Tax=Micromonospora sp. DT4 TaxID=3393438 RepID=UPI003CE6F0E2
EMGWLGRRLGGVFVGADLGGLRQLAPGAVTVVRVDRPRGPRHVVVVARGPEGQLLLVETQAPPGERIVTLDGERALPGSLLGAVSLVVDQDRRLRQWDMLHMRAGVHGDPVGTSRVGVLLDSSSTVHIGMHTGQPYASTSTDHSGSQQH